MLSFTILAYADPGTGMLLWQLLAAFFVGFSFYFRRILKWVTKKFKKETNEE